MEFLPTDPQHDKTHYTLHMSAIQHYNHNSYDLLLENISKYPEGSNPSHYSKQRADHISSLCEPMEYIQKNSGIVFKSLTEYLITNIEDFRYSMRRAEANKNLVSSYGKIKSHSIYVLKVNIVKSTV